jgi:hypothetical protein
VENKQPVVVILGMHRSGTSLLANFVHAIGIDLGQDLLQADEWNAAGYWESREIWETHEKILMELNCDWHNPPLSFPVNWWRQPNIQKLKTGLLEFVRSECRKAEGTWGFKDPRTAIILPLWQEIFEELRLEPLYILTVRNPGSVAASLSDRDRLAFSRSQALWLKTNLDVLSFAGNNLRAIVDYDRWFGSGLEQAHGVVDSLNLSQSVSETRIAEAVNQAIHPGLRHHSSKENVICSPIVTKFYSLLSRAAIEGRVPDEIKEITATFEKSMDLLNIWSDLVTERDAIIAQQNATLAQYNATFEQQNALLAQQNAAFEAKRTRLRKQRQLFAYALITIFVAFSMIFSFVVVGAANWPR